MGVASFISLLVQKVGSDIKPFTSMLLKLLFPAVQDEKSGVAKRAFAGACAIILKYAGSSQAQKLIEDTVALHRGDRNSLICCAIMLKNYSSLAADVMSGYQTLTLPVTFIARFQLDILPFYHIFYPLESFNHYHHQSLVPTVLGSAT